MIRNKKKTLARAFFYSGAMHVIKYLKSNPFIGLTYHRIRSDKNAQTHEFFPFCDDVFGPTEAQFYRQMKWIKKHMYPLSEEELIYSIKNNKELPARSVMVTFDDGYIDTYTIAYPILKNLNIPSILFIPTQAILERKLGWWDLISYFIKHTTKPSFEFRSNYYQLNTHPNQRLNTITLIQNQAKMLKNDLMDSFVDQLAQSCGVQFPNHDQQSGQLMTLEQIVEVSKNIFQIGSHTHSHKILSSLTLEAQREELTLSKQLLEGILGKRVQSIAFPVGGYEHFFTETKTLTKDVGYELAFSNLTGTPQSGQMDPYDIQRIAPPLNRSHFAGALVLPEIFNESFCRLTMPLSYWSESCQQEV